jgi:hypothetical protein
MNGNVRIMSVNYFDQSCRQLSIITGIVLSKNRTEPFSYAINLKGNERGRINEQPIEKKGIKPVYISVKTQLDWYKDVNGKRFI